MPTVGVGAAFVPSIGVRRAVIGYRVFLDGELIEDTFDRYAQDEKGNVWGFGEDTKKPENGRVVSIEGPWEAGVDGAEPGIAMEANPRVGDSYRQECYEGKAEDMAEVLALDDSVSVPHGSFGNILVPKEWNPHEPGVLGYEYRARHRIYRRRDGRGRAGQGRADGRRDRATTAPSELPVRYVVPGRPRFPRFDADKPRGSPQGAAPATDIMGLRRRERAKERTP